MGGRQKAAVSTGGLWVLGEHSESPGIPPLGAYLGALEEKWILEGRPSLSLFTSVTDVSKSWSLMPSAMFLVACVFSPR